MKPEIYICSECESVLRPNEALLSCPYCGEYELEKYIRVFENDEEENES